MASFDFNTVESVKVSFNGVLISEYARETEAIESLVNHALIHNISGTYTIQRPNTEVVFQASVVIPQIGIISGYAELPFSDNETP